MITNSAIQLKNQALSSPSKTNHLSPSPNLKLPDPSSILISFFINISKEQNSEKPENNDEVLAVWLKDRNKQIQKREYLRFF